MVLIFILELFRSIFEGFGFITFESLQSEFIFILEEGSQFEVILGIEGALDCDVVLEQFKELLLELVDFFGDEEGIDEGEIGI